MVEKEDVRVKYIKKIVIFIRRDDADGVVVSKYESKEECYFFSLFSQGIYFYSMLYSLKGIHNSSLLKIAKDGEKRTFNQPTKRLGRKKRVKVSAEMALRFLVVSFERYVVIVAAAAEQWGF